MLINANGGRNFQANPITWSIRKRGNVERTQIIRAKTANTFIRNHNSGGKKGPFQPLRYSVVIIAEIATASVYSARKKSANLMPEYSILKPATISPSASKRSKGVRLISARAAIK